MAKDRNDDYTRPLRRLLTAVLVLLLLALVLVWRIDSPRVERFRVHVMDRVVPSFEWASAPATLALHIAQDFQSYNRIYRQNQELRRELQTMKRWEEAARQLEQENARLLDLNDVRLDPRLTYITGVVLADSGSPFRQSLLLNVGARDGIEDGWATMDGIGLVGRISGVGATTSRVILLTDTASRVPALVQPSGQRAIIMGDNGAAPPIEFLENADQIRPGQRIVTSGDGRLFPPGLLIGHVAQDPGGRLRARLSADLERLEFLRILRDTERVGIEGPGRLIAPDPVAPSEPPGEVSE